MLIPMAIDATKLNFIFSIFNSLFVVIYSQAKVINFANEIRDPPHPWPVRARSTPFIRLKQRRNFPVTTPWVLGLAAYKSNKLTLHKLSFLSMPHLPRNAFPNQLGSWCISVTYFSKIGIIFQSLIGFK